MAVLSCVASLEHPVFPVRLDGGSVDRRPAALLSFSNSKFTGGTMMMAPKANVSDGLLDVIVVNGHVYPQLDKVKLAASAGYRQRKLLYHNLGDGTFEEVAAKFGAVMTDARVSRGLAVGDLDNDGRLDVVINDLDGSPQILHNEQSETGNWLLVRLKGKGMNTGAIGAVVTARAGGIVRNRLVQSGSSYISQEDKRLHFGVGKATQVDLLEVKWPDGTTSALQNVKANQIITIEQR